MCGDGQECSDGLCFPDSCIEDPSNCTIPRCESNTDCASGSTCENSICTETGFCLLSSDDNLCADSESCFAELGCRVFNQICDDSQDCNSDTACVVGECLQNTCAYMANNQSLTCENGGTCDGGTCTMMTDCGPGNYENSGCVCPDGFFGPLCDGICGCGVNSTCNHGATGDGTCICDANTYSCTTECRAPSRVAHLFQTGQLFGVSTVSQSFTTATTGRLVSLSYYTQLNASLNVSWTVYESDQAGAQVIHSGTAQTTNTRTQRVELVDGPILSAGSTYAFVIGASNGNGGGIYHRPNSGGYDGGGIWNATTGTSQAADFCFSVDVVACD